jgi:hypothetical protein
VSTHGLLSFAKGIKEKTEKRTKKTADKKSCIYQLHFIVPSFTARVREHF